MKIEIDGLEKVKSKNKNYINSFETEVSECYQAVAVIINYFNWHM